ncbi:MAG TPA: dUTP diphosphatase [Actinomycetota bacterium]|nr:dUTP diphosphatase [Actinomycetota bacterium]
MRLVRIQVVRLDRAMPSLNPAKPGDAGVDLRATQPASLAPGERSLIPTGVAVAIPEGYAGFVQPRSGMAINKGLGLLNSPGLIDSGYRGEIKVIAINLDSEPLEIARGDRIAQLVILPVPPVEYEEVDELPASERGARGFGSTGTG